MSADTYAIPQEHLDFRDTIRALAQGRIAPRAAEIDREDEYPWDIRELLAEHDVLALPFEEEHGGTGTGTLMLQMAVEEIAKVSASCALILMVQELGTLPIQLFGTDEQKAKWLPRCASGELSPAFALSEPEAGSDPASMRTVAVEDGNEWVINGAKNWISNATVADFYVVFAKTDLESGRISAFVVEKDREGFDPGHLEKKLGIKGSPTGAPTFTDVRVPAENVIGEVGRGLWRGAREPWSARGSAPPRRPWGSPRAPPTTPSHTRASAWRSASRSSSCRDCSSSWPTWRPAPPPPASCSTAPAPPPTAREPGLGKLTSMAKLFASDTAMDVTVEAVQVLGGYGYVNDYPLERMMRDAKITQIYEGTNEIQRVVIARALAGA